MRGWKKLALALALGLLLAVMVSVAGAQMGGGYDLAWYSIDGGARSAAAPATPCKARSASRTPAC